MKAETIKARTNFKKNNNLKFEISEFESNDLKFQDPNERRKEMTYYTYDEFKNFDILHHLKLN